MTARSWCWYRNTCRVMGIVEAEPWPVLQLGDGPLDLHDDLGRLPIWQHPADGFELLGGQPLHRLVAVNWVARSQTSQGTVSAVTIGSSLDLCVSTAGSHHAQFRVPIAQGHTTDADGGFVVTEYPLAGWVTAALE